MKRCKAKPDCTFTFCNWVEKNLVLWCRSCCVEVHIDPFYFRGPKEEHGRAFLGPAHKTREPFPTYNVQTTTAT